MDGFLMEGAITLVVVICVLIVIGIIVVLALGAGEEKDSGRFIKQRLRDSLVKYSGHEDALNASKRRRDTDRPVGYWSESRQEGDLREHHDRVLKDRMSLRRDSTDFELGTVEPAKGLGVEDQHRDDTVECFRDFLRELSGLCDQYTNRLDKIVVTDEQRRTGESPPLVADQEKPEEKDHSPHIATGQESFKPLQEDTLISWWEREGSKRFSLCCQSLRGEFGFLNVEVIEFDPNEREEWFIVGVRKEHQEEYYIIPRKGFWVNRFYGRWFELEEGDLMREGEAIGILRRPLPRAETDQNQWQLIGGKKGKVGVKRRVV